jgi:hypothetical protein
MREFQKELIRLFFEVQGGRIDTETHAGWLGGRIIEYMAEMAAAISAQHLYPGYAEAIIFFKLYSFGVGYVIKTRPAAAAVKLGFTIENHITTGPASVITTFVIVKQSPAKRRFSPLHAQNLIPARG